MTRPGPRLVPLLVVPCVLALLAPIEPAVGWALFGVAAAVLIAFLVEARALSHVVVNVERPASLVLSLDEVESVPFTLRTTAARTLDVILRQRWPALVEDRSTTRRARQEPGSALTLDFATRGVQRGSAELESPHVAMTSWGLAERIVPACGPATLSVVPNLRAIARMSRKLDQLALRGLGSRFSARLGKGREFDRLREYVTGDEFRDIAWKASARHGKLITQEHRLDRSQDVLLCLDRGHRMAARVGQLSKLDHAVNAAVVLAWTCNRMEDRVGFLTFGAAVDQGLAQGRGSAHLRKVLAFATAASAEHVHSDYLALAAHVRRRLRHRTLLLIMTALPESEEQAALVRAVRVLAPHHLPLVVVLTDPDLRAVGRLQPSNERELWRTLVARDVLERRQVTVRELRRAGALVVETAPADTGIESINAYLEVKRRSLL